MVVAFQGCRYLGRCIFESLHFGVVAFQGSSRFAVVLRSLSFGVKFWGCRVLGSSSFEVVEFQGRRVSGALSFGGVEFSVLPLFGSLYF